ncbi:unnamed protein product [Paramecium primaurelia]|uniref:Uncharacterized protein n=1 Tax=Paramecium primaurelia TaxID=5886 RepID=A0A8S1P8M1_PARPR|nr:unnamed protein product [Paramecium primaurelia]
MKIFSSLLIFLFKMNNIFQNIKQLQFIILNSLKKLQSEYFQYQFQVFDYIQELQKENKLIQNFWHSLQMRLYPVKMIYSQLLINHLSEQIVEALKLQKIITIFDFSDTAPFTYLLRYFLKNQH